MHVRRRRYVTLALFFILNFSFFITPVVAQIVPVPGGSCELLTADADKKACREAICPKGFQCGQGKCLTAPGRFAQEKDIALPCNYTLEDLIGAAVRVALFIVGITGSLTLLFFAYGGYAFFTSMGNPESIQKAKGILTAAFIGFILIVGSGFMIQFVAGLVLPAGGIGRELNIEVGTVCNSNAECGENNYVCKNKTCITECQDQKGPEGYFCRQQVCIKDEDCNEQDGHDYVCFDGGCATTAERAMWGQEKLECLTGFCPGGNYNRCCRLKPGQQ